MNNKKILYTATVLGIIIVIGAAVLYALPVKPSEHTVKPIKAISLFIDDVDDNTPLYGNLHDIIYYSNNGTWILQEKEEHNKKFDKKYYISADKYELYSYSPDVAINGSSISFDFGIRNMMGIDIPEVPLTVETRISKKEGEIVSAVQRTIILSNLKEGEFKEIRLTTELAKPAENETLYEEIILTTPFEIKALNGSTARQNTPLPASGSASFYVKPS